MEVKDKSTYSLCSIQSINPMLKRVTQHLMSLLLSILSPKCHLQYIQKSNSIPTCERIRPTKYKNRSHIWSTVPKVISLMLRSESPSFLYSKAVFFMRVEQMGELLHVRALCGGGLERQDRPWRQNEEVLLQEKAGIVAMEAMASPQDHRPYLDCQASTHVYTSRPFSTIPVPSLSKKWNQLIYFLWRILLHTCNQNILFH